MAPPPTPYQGLPGLPLAHYRLQTAEKGLEAGPASLLCQNSTFRARARQPRQWGGGHRYANNEASGMKEGDWGKGWEREGGASCLGSTDVHGTPSNHHPKHLGR